MLLSALLLASLQVLFAFAPMGQMQRAQDSQLREFAFGSQSAAPTRLWMSDEQASGEEEASAEDADEAESEEEEVQEDPEITALKEEIAELESSLKSKRGTLSYTQDQVDNYSKAGYARKVAEMENMRRIRSNMNSNSRASANAAILADFLPAYDTMAQLKEKYGEDEFGSKYSGLTLDTAFSKMGAKDYTVEIGESVDNYRMAVVESEHSTEFAKDTVIRPVALGLELEGNVIRSAECVASLGPEEEESADEEGDDAAPEAEEGDEASP